MGEQALIPTISKELHSSFESYMSSEVFELVAENDVTFFVHKDLLAFHSQPFKEATSGVWKESTERKILLNDWDAKTVGRMVQFLYTGDYKYPGPVATDESTPLEQKAELVPDLPETLDLPKGGTLTPLLECVEGAIHEHVLPPMTDTIWLERVDTANFDFEEIFLAHAKTYVLAHYKSIPALKALAHARLARTLLKLHPFEGNPHLPINIVNLATYVYGNTDCLLNSEEPLRKVISQYVALNFVAWQAEPAAVEMMSSGGDFVRDVLTKYCRRFAHQGIAPPGTRFIEKFHVVNQSIRPIEYVRELNCFTGEEKNVPRTQWLVPEYTTDVNKASAVFFLSQTTGIPISDITGEPCGSSCHINIFASTRVRDKITDMAFIQWNNPFLDMRKFREFDGIVSHTAHEPGSDTVHILWKSVPTAPV